MRLLRLSKKTMLSLAFMLAFFTEAIAWSTATYAAKLQQSEDSPVGAFTLLMAPHRSKKASTPSQKRSSVERHSGARLAVKAPPGGAGTTRGCRQKRQTVDRPAQSAGADNCARQRAH